MTGRERLNQSLLHGTSVGLGGDCFLGRLIGRAFALGLRGGIINVRPRCQRLTPVGHGQIRVVPRRLLKRPDRFGMVESVNQHQPLIEMALGHLRPG